MSMFEDEDEEDFEDPAFPCQTDDQYFGGLSRREFFAGLAMLGFVSEGKLSHGTDIARHSVNRADALIAELDKEESKDAVSNRS